VAGPIVRAKTFLPQIDKTPDYKSIPAANSILLILGGLIKKVIIANYIGTQLVDPFFENPSSFGGIVPLLAIWGYSVQIYCDFSAYSDIAIGLAALLGYHYPANFNHPYAARSVVDFWSRWHISLSTWLRDYLFLPVTYALLRRADKRKIAGITSESRAYIWGTAITMLLGGLWHGASWTFILWGVIHGFALIIHHLSRKWRRRVIRRNNIDRNSIVLKMIEVIFVFNFVSMAWVFFRSPSFGVAMDVFRSIGNTAVINSATVFVILLVAIGILLHFIPHDWRIYIRKRFESMPIVIQGLIAGIVILLIGILGPRGVAPFIYFAF
jgi:D-alanyl-lipoteichoic acid acyltransferase DltB (MBOAT superfamily)